MSKTKILYVEDELFLGKIVKESLESRQFEVVMESDGLRKLSTAQPLTNLAIRENLMNKFKL